MEEPRRIGGFLWVTDINGLRHAIRLGAITSLQDADVDHTEAVIVFNGGRGAIHAAHDLEQVLTQIVG